MALVDATDDQGLSMDSAPTGRAPLLLAVATSITHTFTTFSQTNEGNEQQDSSSKPQQCTVQLTVDGANIIVEDTCSEVPFDQIVNLRIRDLADGSYSVELFYFEPPSTASCCRCPVSLTDTNTPPPLALAVWSATSRNLQDVQTMCQVVSERSFGGERAHKLAMQVSSLNEEREASVQSRDVFAPRYLVFVSPVSGAGKGLEVFQDLVLPVLDRCGVEYDYVISEYAGHVIDAVEQVDQETLMEVDCIIVIGGDGTCYEALQGLKSHLARPHLMHLLDRLALGAIPCGSGNGLSASLHYQAEKRMHPTNALLSIMKGHVKPLDIWNVSWESSEHVSTGNQRAFAFLSLAWGFVADVDIESERWRCVGGARFTLGSVVRVLGLRKYFGRLSYFDDKKAGASIADVATWTKIEDTFTLVWALNMSHGGADLLAAPNAEPDSGYIEIVFVRDCSRFALSRFLLGLEDGSHMNTGAYESIRTKAFRLEVLDPITKSPKEGLMSLDGEAIQCSKIEAHCNPLERVNVSCFR